MLEDETASLLNTIEQKKNALSSFLNKDAPDFPSESSLESGVNRLLQLPDIYGYSYLGHNLYEMLESISGNFGEKNSDIFCQLLALACARRSLTDFNQSNLQTPLKTLYLKWLIKIFDDFPLTMDHPLHNNNLFLKIPRHMQYALHTGWRSMGSRVVRCLQENFILRQCSTVFESCNFFFLENKRISPILSNSHGTEHETSRK